MLLSRFLLNRQKIINPPEIYMAIAKHFVSDTNARFFYRLEWYKIGISVALKVISNVAPIMQVMPECQLIDTTILPDLPNETDELKFSIFAVPDYANADNACDNEEQVIAWLNKKLKKSGVITGYRFGPNNCIYYTNKKEELHQQTVTINGKLKVSDATKLNIIRHSPLGKCFKLGCGYLDIYSYL